MADFGNVPPLLIEELTGSKRRIRMTGRGLPYRPLPFLTRQRVEVTWLPGSPEGTATVLGPTEGPTTLNGEWKEKFINPFHAAFADGKLPPITLNGESLRDVVDVVELFDVICREGQLLEFTWGPHIRRGFLVAFEKRWTTAFDLAWMMEFKWISRGEESGPVVFSTVAGLDDVAAAMADQLDALDALEVPSGFGIDFGILEQLQDFQQGLEDAIFAVTDTVQQFSNQITSVITTVRGIVATFQGLEDDAVALIGFLENQFGSALGLNTGPQSCGTFGVQQLECEVGTQPNLPTDPAVGVVQPTEAQKLEQRIFIANAKVTVQRVLRFAAAERARLTEQLTGEIVGQAMVKDGQDLRDIAQEAYGSPYEWRRLLIFNDLPSIELERGTIIFIPRANPEEAGQACPGL